jgi:hypothetical protein
VCVRVTPLPPLYPKQEIEYNMKPYKVEVRGKSRKLFERKFFDDQPSAEKFFNFLEFHYYEKLKWQHAAITLKKDKEVLRYT